MALNPTRKPNQPLPAAGMQDWASQQVQTQHHEALYAYGELVLFTLLWRVFDFDDGLVARCATCFNGPLGRQAAAFQQSTNTSCPDCYGSTYEGGIRAQIIRPALISDRNAESLDAVARGVFVSETLSMETTGDFTLRQGDVVARYDNTHFQVEEMRQGVLRSGFSPALASDSFGGPVTIHREDPASSQAYLLPPDADTLQDWLAIPGPFLVADITALDQIRPNGYL